MMGDVLTRRWSDIGDRIVTLAEECPEDHYAFRPVPAVRSFAEQLRHVAFWNAYVRDTMRRQPADGEANTLSSEAYPDKAAIVRVVRATFADVARELAAGDGQSDADTLVTFIEHNGEHYGQLVMYYRLNGLVPPASRGT